MSNTVYQIITDHIIEKLESGTVPWHRPWKSRGYPINLISKKPYRGVNVFLLGCSGYVSPYWLSYKQAQDLRGNVKKGEKASIAVFWKQVQVDDKNSETGEIKKKTIPMLRYYRVFNTEQCENINPEKIPVPEIKQNFQPLQQCEFIINNMPNKPNIQHKTQQAYYQPSGDCINMPLQNTFENSEEYYSTLFHELTHSTGHSSRLNRHQKNHCSHHFGSQDYSKEELVAEMGAAFLCGHAGIEMKTLENSAAYIKSWLSKLKDDVRLVISAAAQAQKSTDYILNNPIIEY